MMDHRQDISSKLRTQVLWVLLLQTQTPSLLGLSKMQSFWVRMKSSIRTCLLIRLKLLSGPSRTCRTWVKKLKDLLSTSCHLSMILRPTLKIMWWKLINPSITVPTRIHTTYKSPINPFLKLFFRVNHRSKRISWTLITYPKMFKRPFRDLLSSLTNLRSCNSLGIREVSVLMIALGSTKDRIEETWERQLKLIERPVLLTKRSVTDQLPNLTLLLGVDLKRNNHQNWIGSHPNELLLETAPHALRDLVQDRQSIALVGNLWEQHCWILQPTQTYMKIW